MERTITRIALLHHTGLGNLGDDAVVSAVIGNIRERWRDVEFTILSMNPQDSAGRHGLPCYPIRRYQFEHRDESTQYDSVEGKHRRFRGWLKRARNRAIRIPRALLSEMIFLNDSHKFLKSFDFLLVTGGGQLTGRGGPWSFPYALFIWTLMAKRAGIKCILLTVGAGPLDQRLSRYFVSRTLRRADYVSFRDEESEKLVFELGLTKERGGVFPDNAYGLKGISTADTAKKSTGSVVGVAPMAFPFMDMLRYPANAQSIQDELVEKMATFASLLAGNSFSLSLFGTDTRSDPPEIRRVRALLLNRYAIPVPEHVPPNSVSELLDEMSRFDYIVTCRFHGVVFAHLLNKPVLAIAHHPKVKHLMGALGLSEYCVDMATFDPNQLWGRFQALVANACTIKEKMAVTLTEYRVKSKTQFDEVFVAGSGGIQLGDPIALNKDGVSARREPRDGTRSRRSRDDSNSSPIAVIEL